MQRALGLRPAIAALCQRQRPDALARRCKDGIADRRQDRRQCGFAEGELRAVFVEAQPMGGSSLAWTIADAATGVRERGKLAVDDLRDLQPWGAISSPP